MRQTCYDLCLYGLKIPKELIFNTIAVLKNELAHMFSIKPSGFSDLSQKKIKKYSDLSFSKLADKWDTEGITVYFGGTSGVNDEWEIYLSFYKNTLTVIIDDSLSKNIVNFLYELFNFLDKKSGFDFGFIQNITYKKRPEYYNHGIIGNDWSKADEEKIWSWSMNFNRHDGKYQPGDLRDVYPYNIVSDLHLNRDVHGQSLESWIKSEPSHGTLEKITDTHWLWSIDEKDIPHAQDVLSSANLLVAYWEKYD